MKKIPILRNKTFFFYFIKIISSFFRLSELYRNMKNKFMFSNLLTSVLVFIIQY